MAVGAAMQPNSSSTRHRRPLFRRLLVVPVRSMVAATSAGLVKVVVASSHGGLTSGAPEACLWDAQTA
eukprot:6312393-Alexandrium_andersonii.AAC.1